MLELRDIALIDEAQVFSHRFAASAITVVVGRNASGKTRLARVIAGLDTPARGQVLLDDQDITDSAPGQRSVALVNQAFVNYPHWSVRRNLASPLVAAGRSAADIEQTTQAIAAALGLSELLDRMPQSLSGGQQQRLAIGRALAKGADVLVMDEPLVNLDYKLRESLTSELRTLLHESGVTVVYTTSDPRDAFALGDEVLLLADNTRVQAGTPLMVYEQPASAVAVDLMSDPWGNRLPEGSRLRLVRPEHLYLQRGDGQDHEFSARVLSRETNGSETYLHCEVQGQHWVARLDGLIDVPVDTSVALYATAASVFEFEAASVG
jgi:glycerol transport system ATP-binding protein